MIRCAALLAALVILSACEEPRAPEPDQARYERIVTLAPHLAELAFAVGAGDRIVGVSAYSDYPEAVTRIPVVSDAFTVDQEQLALLKPDLLLAWESGMPSSTIDELRGLGFRVEVVRTRGLQDIADALRQVGKLAGSEAEADRIASAFLNSLAELRADHSGKRRLKVFFQIAEQPLYTVNGRHYISEIIEICGGSNVFAELDDFAPNVDVEAVLERQPEVILASSAGSNFDLWRRLNTLPAVSTDSFFVMPSDEIGRPTPRVLIAARAACRALDDARMRMDDG